MKQLLAIGLVILVALIISTQWKVIKEAEGYDRKRFLAYTPQVHEFKQFNTVCFSHGKSAISCVKVKRGITHDSCSLR